jgi:hypothetical protein
MTPEEELTRLNRVIRQYESVYKTTSDKEQRQRVEKQLKELKKQREQILAVNIIEPEPPAAEGGTSDLSDFQALERLVARESTLDPPKRVPLLWQRDAQPSSAQQEIYHLMLYMRWFREEFLPFLTEKRLKLDFKFSLDRDGFYARFQDIERKLDGFREENKRIQESSAGHEMEIERKKRIGKLTREIEADAAKLYHSVRVFGQELSEDAMGEGVKCLNGNERIEFDRIEGKRALEGRTVRGALDDMTRLGSEIERYLNVPDLDNQES